MANTGPGRKAHTVKNLRKIAAEAGWTERTTGSGHYLLRSPNGETVTLPSTPSGSPRGMMTYMRYMRAAGLPV